MQPGEEACGWGGCGVRAWGVGRGDVGGVGPALPSSLQDATSWRVKIPLSRSAVRFKMIHCIA